MRKNLKELKQRIKNQLGNLSKSQKIVADYMVENPQKFALSSLQELEAELRVSKATIVRLAQALGYDGFHGLKAEFLEEIKNSLEPIQRYKKFLSIPHEKINFVELMAEETIKNIQKTLQLIDKTQYDKALELIEKASHVYFMGMGISSCLAEMATYLFNRASIKSSFIPYGALKFTEQIVNMDKNSVIFAFSFPPYSRETILAARYAQSRGIKVISITDKVTSEISKYSDATIQAAVESVTLSNSIMSVLVLLYSIIAQIGNEFKARTLKTIKAIEYVRKEYE